MLKKEKQVLTLAADLEADETVAQKAPVAVLEPHSATLLFTIELTA
jgi:hypothetical protein